MTKDEARRKQFAEARAEIQACYLANAQAFDKAILALASTFLALSIGFIKDFVPLHLAVFLELLVFSWAALAGSILFTMGSFLLGQKSALTQLDYAEQYYLNEKSEYLNKRNRATRYAKRIDILSATLFGLAVVATIAFAILNLEGAKTVARQKHPAQGAFGKSMTPLPLAPAVGDSGIQTSVSPMPMTPVAPSTMPPTTSEGQSAAPQAPAPPTQQQSSEGSTN